MPDMKRLDPLAFLKKSRDPSRKTLIKVPSETRCIRKVSARVAAALERYSVEEGRLFDIRLCIEEAVRNAMVHGNHTDARLAVRTTYWIEAGNLYIEVEDAGPGFDHTEVADPTTEPHIMKNSGRGVYLIKKLMDRVEYSDKGNKVLMVKRIL